MTKSSKITAKLPIKGSRNGMLSYCAYFESKQNINVVALFIIIIINYLTTKYIYISFLIVVIYHLNLLRRLCWVRAIAYFYTGCFEE